MELVLAFGLEGTRQIGDRDADVNRLDPLQSLRLRAEDAELENKRRNEEDPNQSETSETLRAM
jgi:hypothetical protein